MGEHLEMKRTIGAKGVFSIVTGAMISSGLFVLPGMAFAEAGPAVIISYALAGILIFPSLLSQAEMSTVMACSGGTYFHIERSMGPLVGFIAGLLGWISMALKGAFALVGIGAAIALLFPDLTPSQQMWTIRGIAAAGCLVFLAINLLGVHETVTLQNLLVAVLLLIVTLFIVRGFPQIQLARFDNFNPHGWSNILAVTGMVFISFGGLNKAVNIAGDVKNPGRNMPLGMIAGFLIVTLMYVAAVAVTVGVMEPQTLAGSYAPLAQAGRNIFGGWGTYLIEAGALAAFVTTANAGVFAASRSPLAMSIDGLLPEWFSRMTKKKGIPVNSLFVTVGMMITLILSLDIENLVKTASLMMLLTFFFGIVGHIIMRQSKFQSYRPVYQAPFYPYAQILALVVFVIVIIGMGLLPLMITLGFSLAACVFYLLYVSKRIDREGALAHLIKQTFSQDVRRTNIEDELVQMALERDEHSLDRFDKLVRDCLVIDLPDKIDFMDFLERISHELSGQSGLTSARLKEMLLDRERNSSTVIEPGLAIPHLIIPGTDKFILAMVRAKEGIYFDPVHAPVKMCFVLLGTEDQRNFHLKSLMNIAHIVQEPQFSDRWTQAQNIDQLRDLVILTRRNR